MKLVPQIFLVHIHNISTDTHLKAIGKIRRLVRVEFYSKDTSKLDYVCDFYDGEVYTFVFCVPNFARLLQFVRKVKFAVPPKETIRVICFDYQAEFIKSILDGYAEIFSCSFEDFLKDWNSKKLVQQKAI